MHTLSFMSVSRNFISTSRKRHHSCTNVDAPLLGGRAKFRIFGGGGGGGGAGGKFPAGT